MKNGSAASNRQKIVQNVAVLGVLSALAVVSAMWLTVRVGQFIKLSPVFLVVALAGYLYGVWGACLVAVISDVLQSLLAGLGFSPLILVVNVFTAVIFGWFLHNKNRTLNIVMAVLLTQVVGSLCLNTLALSFHFGIPIFQMIYWRLLQTAILIPIEILVLWLVLVVLKLPNRLKR